MAAALALIPLAAAAGALAGKAAPPTRFAVTTVSTGSPVAEFDTQVVARGEAGLLHAPSIAPTPDGELIAVWFEGSREGAADVEIRSARFSGGTWQPSRVVTSAAATARELGRHIKTVGNAVLVTNGDELWMVYVSVSLGGWATSQLNLKRSPDGGETWAAAERLVTSPFLNLSTLAKTRAIRLDDGRIALPAYHEMAAKLPELVVLGRNGRVADKRRMGGWGRIAIQPAVAPLDGERALALMRRARARDPHVFASETADGGRTWSTIRPTGLPNPGGPTGLLRLDEGTLLLTFNDSAGRETDLTLALSRDGGASWQRIAVLAEMDPAGPGEITYPFMTADGEGTIHVVWADRRDSTIRHARFNRAWLADRAGQVP